MRMATGRKVSADKAWAGVDLPLASGGTCAKKYREASSRGALRTCCHTMLWIAVVYISHARNTNELGDVCPDLTGTAKYYLSNPGPFDGLGDSRPYLADLSLIPDDPQQGRHRRSIVEMMTDEQHGGFDDRGLDRILSLSDGIFAFAITLLVLNLTVPSLDQAATSSNFLSSLGTEYPKYIAYIVSFYAISNYWLAHHRIFRYVKRYDSRLIQLNLVFLLFITIVPFFTELISNYGSLAAADDIFYLSQAFGGFLLTFIWIHASKGFLLIQEDTPKNLIRWVTVRGLISPFVFLAAVVVAFFVPSYSALTLIAIGPLSRILFKKMVPQGRQMRKDRGHSPTTADD
jgi:uncharacterized membrane protein